MQFDGDALAHANDATSDRHFAQRGRRGWRRNGNRRSRRHIDGATHLHHPTHLHPTKDVHAAAELHPAGDVHAVEDVYQHAGHADRDIYAHSDDNAGHANRHVYAHGDSSFDFGGADGNGADGLDRHGHGHSVAAATTRVAHKRRVTHEHLTAL